MTPVEQEAVDQFVEDELKAGKIRESKSPYASPCFFIVKKDGSRCLVQDYRKINAFTVKDKTPLPRIDDPLDVLEDESYSPKWISSGDTITYESKKVMSGKPPSSCQKVFSSQPSCISDCVIRQELSCA